MPTLKIAGTSWRDGMRNRPINARNTNNKKDAPIMRMQANHTAATDQRARLLAEANGLRDRAEVLVGRR